MRLKDLTPDQRQLLREYLSDRMHTMDVYLRNLCSQKYSYRTKALSGQIAYYRNVVAWIRGELTTVDQSDAASKAKAAPGSQDGSRHGNSRRNRRGRATA